MVPLWTEEPSVLSFFKYLSHQSVSVSIVGPCWIHYSLVSYRLSSLHRTRYCPAPHADFAACWAPSASEHYLCLMDICALCVHKRCGDPHADSSRGSHSWVRWGFRQEEETKAVSRKTREEICVLQVLFYASWFNSAGLQGCPFKPRPLQHTSRALANQSSRQQKGQHFTFPP